MNKCKDTVNIRLLQTKFYISLHPISKTVKRTNVKRTQRKIWAIVLLILFGVFQVDVAVFSHIHYVDGNYLIHAHPFQETHNHSEASLQTIGFFPVSGQVFSSNVVADEPDWMLLAEYVIPNDQFCLYGDIIRSFSLRAPPIFPFK